MSGKGSKNNGSTFIPWSTWKTMSKKQKEQSIAAFAATKKKGAAPKKEKLSKTDRMSLIKQAGAHGTDTRNPALAVERMGEQKFAIPQQDPTLNIPVTFNDRAVSYLAMGICLRALRHGFGGGLTNAYRPIYHAFIYLRDAFKTAIEGTVPQFQSAPRFIWEIVAALLPKTMNFKTGAVSYSGKWYDDGIGDDPLFALGTGDQQYAIYWGRGATGDVNGFQQLTAPDPYTVEQGEAAVQQLFDYYRGGGLSTRSGQLPAEELWMTGDTSAFCAVYSEMGTSYFSPVGFVQEVFSERQIGAPIFAKFVGYQPELSSDDAFQWRSFHEFRHSGGSACYLGPRISEMATPKEMFNKQTPVMKTINFDEFFEVLSLILGQAAQKIVDAGENNPLPCPLTSQEVQLALRQTIMSRFNNDLAQDLRWAGAEYITMLPFVSGPNGVSAEPTGMLLPLVLAENIRCLSRTTAELNNRKYGGGLVFDEVPILVRPANSVIGPLKNYIGPGDVNVYTESETEVPISLIDCSAIVDSSTLFVTLNGSKMNEIIATWNDFITKMSGALVSLTDASTDMGPSVLSSLVYTHLYRYTPPQPIVTNTPVVATKSSTVTSTAAANAPTGSTGHRRKLSAEPPHAKSYGTKVKRHKLGATPGPGSEYFQNVYSMNQLAQVGFHATIYKYVRAFVLPSLFVLGPGLSASLSSVQSAYMEPFNIAMSSTYNAVQPDADEINPFPTVYERHVMLANMNVKAWNAPGLSETETELIELTKRGKGGFLGDAVSSLASSIGFGGLGKVIKVVGDATGL